jgi:hypothetical protein
MIDNNAFEYCERLTSIYFPKIVKIGGDGLWVPFYGCDSLKHVHFTASLENMMEGDFANCRSLENITVDPDNKEFKSIDGVLYIKDDETATKDDCGRSDKTCKMRLIRYPEAKPQPQHGCFANLYGGFSFTECNYMDMDKSKKGVTAKLPKVVSKETGSKSPVLSGYKELDKLIGGFYPGSITMIAGINADVETNFSLNITRNVAIEEGINVLFFSIKECPWDFWDRLQAMEAQKDFKILKVTKEVNWSDIKKLCLAFHRLEDAGIVFEYSNSYPSADDVRDKCMNFFNEHKGERSFIVFDDLRVEKFAYIDENGNQITSPSYVECLNLVGIATEFNVPLIVISEEFHSAGNEYSVNDILNSDSPEDYDVFDQMIFLKNDSTNPASDEKKDEEMEVNVFKNKNGATGTFKLMKHIDYFKFEEVC